MTPFQTERVKLYVTGLVLLSPQTVSLFFARSWWSSNPFPNQFSSWKQQRINLEKISVNTFLLALWVELAHPNVSGAPKHIKKGRKPHVQEVELRKEGMGLPFFGCSQLLDQLSCNKSITSLRDHNRGGNWIWFMPSTCSHPTFHIGYGQGLTSCGLRRMFYGLSLQALTGSWKIHRHCPFMCAERCVCERRSYKVLSKREVCISEKKREI